MRATLIGLLEVSALTNATALLPKTYHLTGKSLIPSELQVATSARAKSVINFSCDSCVQEKSLQLPAVFWGLITMLIRGCRHLC